MGRSECGTAASGTTWAPCRARLARLARRGQQVQQVQQARRGPQARRGLPARPARPARPDPQDLRPTSRSFYPAAPGPNPPESPLSTWRSPAAAAAAAAVALSRLEQLALGEEEAAAGAKPLDGSARPSWDPRKPSPLEPAALAGSPPPAPVAAPGAQAAHPVLVLGVSQPPAPAEGGALLVGSQAPALRMVRPAWPACSREQAAQQDPAAPLASRHLAA